LPIRAFGPVCGGVAGMRSGSRRKASSWMFTLDAAWSVAHGLPPSGCLRSRPSRRSTGTAARVLGRDVRCVRLAKSVMRTVWWVGRPGKLSRESATTFPCSSGPAFMRFTAPKLSPDDNDGGHGDDPPERRWRSMRRPGQRNGLIRHLQA
jgi:hypothetical protein